MSTVLSPDHTWENRLGGHSNTAAKVKIVRFNPHISKKVKRVMTAHCPTYDLDRMKLAVAAPVHDLPRGLSLEEKRQHLLAAAQRLRETTP